MPVYITYHILTGALRGGRGGILYHWQKLRIAIGMCSIPIEAWQTKKGGRQGGGPPSSFSDPMCVPLRQARGPGDP